MHALLGRDVHGQGVRLSVKVRLEKGFNARIAIGLGMRVRNSVCSGPGRD